MSASHANKGGARYRYYVSRAVLQNTRPPTPSITRLPAAELETLVITALRNHLQENVAPTQSAPDNDRELVEHHVERITLAPKHIKLQLRQNIDACNAVDDGSQSRAGPISGVTITIPWKSPIPATVKGIIHVPAHNTPMKPSPSRILPAARR